jgi:hypothetical protein
MHQDDALDELIGALSQEPSDSERISATIDREKSAIFRDAQQCYFDEDAAKSLESNMIECESIAGIEQVKQQYEMCSENLESRKKELERLGARLKSCQSGEDLRRKYFEAARLAAERGDPDAQLCYIESSFGGIEHSQKEKAEYDQRTPKYVANAFARGDWRVVWLLSRGDRPMDGLFYRLSEGDLLTRYRMNRLLRLGAEGKYARRLDLEAKYLQTSSSPDQGTILKPDEIIAAERWAQQVHKDRFSSSPSLREAPEACPH